MLQGRKGIKVSLLSSFSSPRFLPSRRAWPVGLRAESLFLGGDSREWWWSVETEATKEGKSRQQCILEKCTTGSRWVLILLRTCADPHIVQPLELSSSEKEAFLHQIPFPCTCRLCIHTCHATLRAWKVFLGIHVCRVWEALGQSVKDNGRAEPLSSHWTSDVDRWSQVTPDHLWALPL